MGPDGGGILSDAGGDAATINTDCYAPTLGTTKSYLNPPINYLAPPIPIPVPVSQATNQLADKLPAKLATKVNSKETTKVIPSPSAKLPT